jgi:hypothetical protein
MTRLRTWYLVASLGCVSLGAACGDDEAPIVDAGAPFDSGPATEDDGGSPEDAGSPDARVCMPAGAACGPGSGTKTPCCGGCLAEKDMVGACQ